jgi:hypothetical protein
MISGGAANGTVLKLVNNCAPNLTDCTWTYAPPIPPPATPPPIVSADTDDEQVGPGFRMQTSVKLVKATGLLDGVTHTWSTNDFLGFTGGVQVWLLDSNGVLIQETDLRTFGVDGRDVPFTQNNRLDNWSQSFDPASVAGVVTLQIVHGHFPVDRFELDIAKLGAAATAVKTRVCSIDSSLPICKSSSTGG